MSPNNKLKTSKNKHHAQKQQVIYNMSNACVHILQHDGDRQCLLQCLVHPTKGNHQHTTTWDVMNNYKRVPNSLLHWVTLTDRNLMILKMCCINRLLCILICWHGWIIVHFQTFLAVPPHLLILIFFAALAALAAAAAVFATEAQSRGHHSVPGCHGVQGPRQKVPAAKDNGQVPGAARLHHVDNDHKDNQHNDGHANADQDLPASQRQAEYRDR